MSVAFLFTSLALPLYPIVLLLTTYENNQIFKLFDVVLHTILEKIYICKYFSVFPLFFSLYISYIL